MKQYILVVTGLTIDYPGIIIPKQIYTETDIIKYIKDKYDILLEPKFLTFLTQGEEYVYAIYDDGFLYEKVKVGLQYL